MLVGEPVSRPTGCIEFHDNSLAAIVGGVCRNEEIRVLGEAENNDLGRVLHTAGRESNHQVGGTVIVEGYRVGEDESRKEGEEGKEGGDHAEDRHGDGVRW